jgi:hypothetical protein
MIQDFTNWIKLTNAPFNLPWLRQNRSIKEGVNSPRPCRWVGIWKPYQFSTDSLVSLKCVSDVFPVSALRATRSDRSSEKYVDILFHSNAKPGPSPRSSTVMAKEQIFSTLCRITEVTYKNCVHTDDRTMTWGHRGRFDGRRCRRRIPFRTSKIHVTKHVRIWNCAPSTQLGTR